MTVRRGKVPLDELAKMLHDNPIFAAQWKKERDERIEAKKLAYRESIQPILLALHEAGIHIHSVSSEDLKRTGAYTKALSILAEHLKEPYPPDVLWSIATTFAVPEGRPYWSMLVDEYKNAADEDMGPKDGLANALAKTVTKDTIDDLIALAKDTTHGSSRVILLDGIRRSRTPQAKRAIEELARDPELAKEIASWKRPKPLSN